MKSIREKIRNRAIAMICRSERKELEDEWVWIEWKRRVVMRMAGVLVGMAVLFFVVKFAADSSRGGHYDAWAEAIGAARREQGAVR